MANHQHLTINTQHPTIAVTLCVICMPEAFCGLETWVEKFCKICEFCEKNKRYEVCKQPSRGNLTYHAPPCGGGVGGGATRLWVRYCAQKSSVKSVRSVRKELLSNSQATFLLQWMRPISHRVTQKNRTHKLSQRH